MKYHSPADTIIISILVLLVFAAVAVVTVSFLSMTSPTLILTERILSDLASAESPVSISFDSIDRNLRDGVFINNLQVYYKGSKAAGFETVRAHMGLFELLRYFVLSTGHLELEGMNGNITITPEMLSGGGSAAGGGFSADMLGSHSFSIHLHGFDISLPDSASLDNAELSVYVENGIEGLSGSLIADGLSYDGSYGRINSEDVRASFGYDRGLQIAAYASGINGSYQDISGQIGDAALTLSMGEDDALSVSASLTSLSGMYKGISVTTGSSSLSYSSSGFELVLLDLRASDDKGSLSFRRLDGYSADLKRGHFVLFDTAFRLGELRIDAPLAEAELSGEERSISVYSELVSADLPENPSSPLLSSLNLKEISFLLSEREGEYTSSLSFDTSVSDAEGLLAGSEGSVKADAVFSSTELLSLELDIIDLASPLFGEALNASAAYKDGELGFSIDAGSEIRASGRYGSDISLYLSMSDFRLKPFRSFADIFLPSVSSYIGDSTALSGNANIRIDRETMTGPISMGFALSGIRFNQYSFSLGAYAEADLEGSTLSVPSLSITTDWVRLGWSGTVDLGRKLPDGRFILTSTDSGNELFIADLNLTDENEYTFDSYIPRFEGSWFRGSVDFSGENLITAAAELKSGMSSYPFDLRVDLDSRLITLINPALDIRVDYSDLITGSIEFTRFELPTPSEDVAPCVLTGRIDTLIDLGGQSIMIDAPFFQIVNMRHLPTDPDLSFSAHADNSGIVFRDIIFAGIETEPLRGMMNLDFEAHRYSLYLSSQRSGNPEELMASLVQENGMFSGILRLNRFNMDRFGFIDTVGNISMTGRGGSLEDMSLSGTVSLESEDMINNPRAISAELYLDNTQLRFEDIIYASDKVSIRSDMISYGSDDGTLSTSLSLSYGTQLVTGQPLLRTEADAEFFIGKGYSLYEAIRNLAGGNAAIEGRVSLHDLVIDDRLACPETAADISYNGSRIDFSGDISGYYDISSSLVDISVDLLPIADFTLRSDLGSYWEIDIRSFEVSIANLAFKYPVLVFYDPAPLWGRIYAAKRGPDWVLDGYLEAEKVEFDVFWMPDERIILHNPTFTIWNSQIDSNIDDCTILRLDTYERIPGRVAFGVSLGRDLSFDSYYVDVYAEEGQEVGIRLPMSESNIDIWGDVSGYLHIVSDIATVDVSGTLKAKNFRMSIGMEPLPSWWVPPRARTSFSFDILLQENVSFVYPLGSNPILTANLAENQRLNVSVSDGGIDVSGNLAIRSGEFFYFQKNFYITEGNIRFDELSYETRFNPMIDLRARIRDFDSRGDNVDIYLVLRNATLDNLNPTFESSPAKDINEIMTILGGAILPSSAYGNISFTSIFSLVSASMDVLTRFGILNNQEMGIEESIRSSLGLDTFSLHTNIIENILVDTVSLASSSLIEDLSPMARYLNGTTMYMGKYLQPQLYLQAMVHLNANSDQTDTRSTFIADDLNLDIEVSLEWENPLATFRFFTQPTNLTFFDLIDSFGFGFSKRIVW